MAGTARPDAFSLGYDPFTFFEIVLFLPWRPLSGACRHTPAPGCLSRGTIRWRRSFHIHELEPEAHRSILTSNIYIKLHSMCMCAKYN